MLDRRRYREIAKSLNEMRLEIGSMERDERGDFDTREQMMGLISIVNEVAAAVAAQKPSEV